MEMAGAPSLAALRAQLLSLEQDRDAWTKQHKMNAERCAWIERRQQQQARLDALANAASPEEIAPAVIENGAPTVDAAERAKASKREEIHELREKTLQLIKTQQQVASKMTSQLRTMRVNDASPSSGSSTAASRSPSPPQETRDVNGHATRRSNKLVLIPTLTTALGKRPLAAGGGATVVPIVSFPPLTRTAHVPSESPEALASIAFRVATRHYLQHGTTMTRSALRTSVEACIGRGLREDQVYAILEDARAAIHVVVRDVERHSSDPQRPSTQTTVRLTDKTVHAWLDAEKNAMDELLTAWAALSPSAPRAAQVVAAVRAHKFTDTVHGSHPVTTALTVDTLLSALVSGSGRTCDPTAAVVDATAFPHLTLLFQDAHEWLTQVATTKDTPAVVGRTTASTDVVPSVLRFTRPFDLENASVLKQIQPSRKRQRRADPMKVMCMYELSGACNDPHCAYQHQRDFEARDEPDETAPVQEPQTQSALLQLPVSAAATMHQFVQLRESVQSRWPSLSEILTSSGRVVLPTEGTQPEVTLPSPPDQQPLPEDTIASKSWDIDFVELGSPLSPMGESDIGGQRYCRDDTMGGDAASGRGAFSSSSALSRFSVASLETHVKQHPEDVDAWLLLALRSLQLEISSGDENVVRVSEPQRLLAEVEELYRLLQNHRPMELPLYEASIEQCLHVLSRALEIEANAYCEELWLLHLRLSQLLTTKRDIESELEMTEQALRFVRTSVSLWRHFLTLQAPSLNQLDESVATYRALLGHMAEASTQATQQQLRESFSVLLCDVVVQLCAIYCDAGRAADASTFLQAFLASSRRGATAMEDEDQDDEAPHPWQAVRDQMMGDEVLILHLVHVHLAVFATVPSWLCARAFRVADPVSVNVHRLLLSSECIQQLQSSGSLDLRPALRICETAFDTISDAAFIPPGVEVLRYNWIVLYAHADHMELPTRREQLTLFAEEELQRVTLLPRVITLLIHLFRRSYHKPDLETKLLEDLMAQYKTTDSTLPVTHVYQRFGEALHHYLLHKPHRFVDDPLRTAFPTLKFMLVRLTAMLPGKKNPVYAKRAIHAALRTDVEWTTQRHSLIALFTALVRDTLSHIVGESGHDETDELDDQDMTQDTYYLIAQVQLLSQVCGVETACEILDTVVIQSGQSPQCQWRLLPRECRRMVWSVRCGLLLDVLKQDGDRTPRARELLGQLLDRYLTDVGPRSDTARRAVRQQLTSRLGAKENDDAIPTLGKAIGLCVDYAGRGGGASDSKSSSLDMMLFRLGLASTPLHERPSLFAAYHHQLGVYPAFWFSYAATALQDSDWRRVRSGLRRLVLASDARGLDAASLRFLVALELQDKNVQGAAHALGHRLRVNPLDSAAWEIVSVLEVLFDGGGMTNTRITEIVTKLRETGGVVLHTRSILGDVASSISLPPLTSTTSPLLTHATCTGLRLDHVPSALAMHFSESLRVLDLSHNQLLTLPTAVCCLTKLRVLNVAGNSLVALPPQIGQLVALQVLALDHNNLLEIPNAVWDCLLQLRDVDVRCNALAGISPRVVHLTNLRVLRVVGNHVVWKDLEPISTKLPVACLVDIAPTNAQRNDAFEDDETKTDCAETRVGIERPNDSLVSAKASPKDVDMTASDGVDPQRGEGRSVSDLSLPTTPPELVETVSSVFSRTDENVIALDDDEDESKSDSSPRRERDLDETRKDVDVEMARPSSPPARDKGETSDDDEVECLGSSLSTAAAAVVRAGGSPVTPRDEPETRRRLVTKTIDMNSHHLRCTICAAPNISGTHQRLNLSVLCVACLAVAVDVLRERPVEP